MRFILGIVCFIVSVMGGFILSLKYSERKNFYADFINFNKKLKLEMVFSKKTLIELIIELPKDIFFNRVLFDVIMNKKTICVKFLNEEENTFFLNYLSEIGGSDSISQMDYLNSAELYLEEKYSFYQSEEKKYRSLFIKMGFLIGLVLFIALL